MDKSTEYGVGLCAVLFIVFLVLKLTHLIDWSWWWITAPVWIPVAIGLVIVIVAAFAVILNARKFKRLRRK